VPLERGALNTLFAIVKPVVGGERGKCTQGMTSISTAIITYWVLIKTARVGDIGRQGTKKKSEVYFTWNYVESKCALVMSTTAVK
jgi:hypothetical protein